MTSDSWADARATEIARAFHDRQRHYQPLFNQEAFAPWDELSEDYQYLLTLIFKEMILRGVISAPL